MGKAFRRTSVAALAAASALSLGATAALAANADALQDDTDGILDNWQIDNNTENVFRVAGPDRISTAISLMNSTEKWVDGADRIIVATSENFADALSAGPLADVYDAPILLSKPGSTLDPRVLNAILDKGADQVTLIGGTGVFTEGVRGQLEAEGIDVDRQRGVDRYATAAGIAQRTANVITNDGVNPRTINVYLATGIDFPDALAAGAAAADNDGVVLLTKDDTIERFTYDFLVNQANRLPALANGIEIHTVGGQAEEAAEDAGLEDVADTNSGVDRYETAVMLASKYQNGIEKIAVVSGQTFADGVAGGAFIANHDGALLLTNNDRLNHRTKAFLASYSDNNALGDVEMVIIGGTGSVSRAVSDQLLAMNIW